jgi:signal transduction histidine kinase
MEEENRILVIDDEINLCEGVRRALQPEGLHVDIAVDGKSGLEKVRSGNYVLVLIDIMMPDISGVDLISSIHDVDPEIVCIIITGYATVELAVQSIKRGAYDFLTKPFSVDDLVLSVQQGLERRLLSLEAKRTQAAEAESRRLAEEKKRLEELDRAKRQFIRLVTHELQSPVSAIENYLKLILDGYVSPNEVPEILERCIHRTQEERALIADLLELGHLDVIENFKTEEVHLDQVLHNVIASLRGEINRKNLQLEMQCAPNIPVVYANSEQIKSLWSNLISNAIKYTPENGSIKIGLNVDDENIVGSVQDSGIGIPDKDKGQIFSEFYRAQNAKDLNVPGTGLGLSIIKRIVEGLGGAIHLKSQVGQGTIFTFCIPVK